jgi:acetolactate synthase-1/2/3 large subunit
MPEYKGAEVLVKSLKDLGVERIFGYTGGVILPVFKALGEAGIDVVINSNEQAAAFAAAGESRSTDKVGVTIVTSGPSVANTLTAVCDSFCDSVPLIVISGQVPENKIGTDAFQYMDVPGIFREGKATKKTILMNGQGIEELIKDSYFLAKSGKPGPIVIDLPVDKQQKAYSYNALPVKRYQDKYEKEHHMGKGQCRDFFEHLKDAKRPLLYLGGGVNSEEASAKLRQLNQILGIPFVNTLMAKGTLDENDALAMGMLGMFGTPSANMIVQDTDFFFALGVRWDDRVAEKVGTFGPKSKIAYIDINPEKVEQIRNDREPVFSFVGNASHALSDLIDYAISEDVKLDIQKWRDYASLVKSRWPLDYNKESAAIQEAHAIALLNELKDKDTIITTGVGNHQMLAAQHLLMSRPKSFLTSGSFGTMGFGLPAAIGAWYAHPDRTVIDVDGDGSLSMNLGELRTVGLYDIPVKILVLNNLGDGMVRNLQDYAYEGNRTGTSRPKDINLSEIAKDCNFKYARRVSNKGELEEAMKEFISAEGPCMLEVMTDREEVLYPKVPAGKTYKEMILGPYIKERT